MKSRAYRRYMEEVKVIKRLRYRCYGWYRYVYDANDMRISCGKWFDMISTQTAFDAKSITTDEYDSRGKTKWGRKGKSTRYSDSSDKWTRVNDKKRFKKDLEYEGFKHLPTYTQYGPELESEEQHDLLP